MNDLNARSELSVVIASTVLYYAAYLDGRSVTSLAVLEELMT
jgi:hypothetical protein